MKATHEESQRDAEHARQQIKEAVATRRRPGSAATSLRSDSTDDLFGSRPAPKQLDPEEQRQLEEQERILREESVRL